MNSADPLATIAAAPEAPTLTTPPSGAAEPAAAPVRGNSRGKVLLLTCLLCFLIGAGACGAAWWFWPTAAPASIEAATDLPVAAEPSAPPQPVSFALATSPTNTEEAPDQKLDKTIERLPTVVEGLSERLASAPLEGSAPPGFIVLSSGGQSDTDAHDIPRHQRWEFRFAPGNTIESYARQLDFFQIELGVLGGSDKVIYLSKLSDPQPTQRTAAAQDEGRLYMLWQRGSMRAADEEIVARAEIATQGKVYAHFLPAELEAKLAKLEDAHARKTGATKIRKTIFGMKPDFEDGYQFYVVDQKADE